MQRIRSISLRVVGIMVLILAVLFTIVRYSLRATLNYPDILLDRPSFAASLLAQGEMLISDTGASGRVEAERRGVAGSPGGDASADGPGYDRRHV